MTTPSLRLARLLRPYWKLLAVAFAAMLAAGAVELLEPWPLKVVLDHVIGSKPAPLWLHDWTGGAHSKIELLYLAAAAVVIIALLGAVSSYTEKYLSTTVGKRVGYDLRHMLYHHVQRQSLSFYEHRQTGDMVVRLTGDINA